MTERARSPVAGQSGFTLLEVKVVVVIIATLTGLVLISIGGEGSRDRELRREADRFATVLRMAGEDAVLRGLELGLRIDRHSYDFLVLEPDAWVSWSGDSRALQPHQMPSDFEMDVQVEGLPVELGDEEGDQPHIVVLSSGELTPFEVRFGVLGEAPVLLVEGERAGQIEVRRINER